MFWYTIANHKQCVLQGSLHGQLSGSPCKDWLLLFFKPESIIIERIREPEQKETE